MNDSIEAADVLERAADLLFVRGRARGTGEDANGAVCVGGAVAAANGFSPRHVGRVDWFDGGPELEAYLLAHPEVRSGGAVTDLHWQRQGRFPAWVWNDMTDDDALVIDTLKRCAKELRALTP